MNRFRTKKKAKEASEGIGRASNDSDAPPPLSTLKASKTFRLGGRKHQEPEPKLELDLANALPSSDDFRTSLLMSGLSARFSMLREQDDPKSKIGKASDDSVLFSSKRQSRLNDFGFSSNGLSDIAEVSSINGSIRPPFAKSRTDSFGYGTDDESVHSGSIMHRAKPGEGNNLFGGRQKIYKIPAKASGSTKNLADGSDVGGMGGRILYDHDVSQSAFQKLREQEKEQQRERERAEAATNSQYTRSASPPLAGYNRNRETSSTTSSAGPSITRCSTAATSFTSQRTPSLSGTQTPITPGAPSSVQGSVERTTTKARRLYETGLDQHLNEQQSSAMNRIETLTRQRTLGAQSPPSLASPTASAYASDRWDRQQIAGKASMPNMRTTSSSPTLATRGNFDFGVRSNIVTERLQAFGSVGPLSPPISGDDDQTVLAVQPNDRGKATALGAFSKPVKPYDESQYSQRQLQMQLGRDVSEGRDTPPPRKNSPPRAFVPRPRPGGRPRGDSNATFTSASARSRSNSSAQSHVFPQERAQEKTVPQIVETDNEFSNPGMSFLSSPNESSVGSPISASKDVESNPEYQPAPKPIDLYNKYMQEQPSSLERPPESEHPALRVKPFVFQDSNDDSVSPTSSATPRLQVDESPAPFDPKSAPSDSPTLGPTTGLGSLIHKHMRMDSNNSSIYGGSTYGGMPSSGFVSRFPDEPTEPLPQHQYGSKTNPWEHNDWDAHSDGDDMNNFSLEGAVHGQQTETIVPLPLNPKSPNIGPGIERKSHWEKELEAHHKRNGSTETQKEQQDFKMDLAARRRKVQENLKSFVETESRSASPALGGSEHSKDHQLRTNPLGLLRSKTTRSSVVIKTDKAGQSKAMKMLGIGHTTISSSPSPGKSDFDEGLWKHEEEEMLRGTKSHVLPAIIPTAPIVAPQNKAFRQARRDAQRDREKQIAMRHQQRMALEGAEQDWANANLTDQGQRGPMRDNAPPNIRIRQRSPSHETLPSPRAVQNGHRNGGNQERSSQEEKRPALPSTRSSRDRSSSDASGRSKSRNGRYKDDLAKSMAEGTSSSTRAFPEGLNPPPTHFLPRSPGTPGLPFSPSPIPSPVNGSIAASRNRSNSKSGYFDGHKLQPLQTGDGVDIGFSPRPSPITPFSANTTPSLMQPSPGASRVAMPTTQGLPSDPRAPGARKRSVNKSEISEPRFISSTSRVTTVDLAPGVSLQSGSDAAPPIPAVNPRRKTRAMFGFGKKEDLDDYSLPAATQSTEEMSTFSADEDTKPKSRGMLRKISSEGGNLNIRARQAANAVPSPAVPAFPSSAGLPPAPQVPGGMF